MLHLLVPFLIFVKSRPRKFNFVWTESDVDYVGKLLERYYMTMTKHDPENKGCERYASMPIDCIESILEQLIKHYLRNYKSKLDTDVYNYLNENIEEMSDCTCFTSLVEIRDLKNWYKAKVDFQKPIKNMRNKNLQTP